MGCDQRRGMRKRCRREPAERGRVADADDDWARGRRSRPHRRRRFDGRRGHARCVRRERHGHRQRRCLGRGAHRRARRADGRADSRACGATGSSGGKPAERRRCESSSGDACAGGSCLGEPSGGEPSADERPGCNPAAGEQTFELASCSSGCEPAAGESTAFESAAREPAVRAQLLRDRAAGESPRDGVERLRRRGARAKDDDTPAGALGSVTPRPTGTRAAGRPDASDASRSCPSSVGHGPQGLAWHPPWPPVTPVRDRKVRGLSRTRGCRWPGPARTWRQRRPRSWWPCRRPDAPPR
jgi:hypothetical protein